MKQRRTCALLAVVMVLAVTWAGGPAEAAEPGQTWLAAAQDAEKDKAAVGPAAPQPEKAGPPERAWWGMHTIEGVGGGQIVPTAYLTNPKPVHFKIFGNPTVSASFWGRCGRKNLLTFAVSETILERIELSYAFNRFDTGNLAHVVRKIIANSIEDRNVLLHNWNIRGLLIEEDSFGIPMPAITGGVHFKYNSTIEDINDRLLVPLDAIGYERSSGVDFTLFATKTLDFKPLPRTVVTVGVRNSDASDMGFLGFGDHRVNTLELGVQVFPIDQVFLSYEFRRRERQFSRMPVGGMLLGEENWHAFGVGWLITEDLSLNLGVLFLGNVANQKDAVGTALQFRWAI